MPNRNDIIGRMRLQRDDEHLYRLHGLAIAKLLHQIMRDHACLADILDTLDYWQATLRQEAVRAVNGDRFPPRLRLVAQRADRVLKRAGA
jgi:hypothetical protein